MIAYKPDPNDNKYIINLDMCTSIEMDQRRNTDDRKIIIFRTGETFLQFNYSNKESDRRYAEIERLVGIQSEKLPTKDSIKK